MTWNFGYLQSNDNVFHDDSHESSMNSAPPKKLGSTHSARDSLSFPPEMEFHAMLKEFHLFH